MQSTVRVRRKAKVVHYQTKVMSASHKGEKRAKHAGAEAHKHGPRLPKFGLGYRDGQGKGQRMCGEYRSWKEGGPHPPQTLLLV
jgi:hypothetical protein